MYVATYKSNLHIGTEILSSEWKGHKSTLSETKIDFEPAPRKLSTSPLRWSYNNLQKNSQQNQEKQ